MGMLLTLMVFMYMFSLPVKVRGAESEEAREARQTKDRIHTAKVRDDDVDWHVIEVGDKSNVNDDDNDDDVEDDQHVLIANLGEGS